MMCYNVIDIDVARRKCWLNMTDRSININVLQQATLLMISSHSIKGCELDYPSD